jgi:heme/copper-type cytochrome/quinol oxidase subunit 2
MASRPRRLPNLALSEPGRRSRSTRPIGWLEASRVVRTDGESRTAATLKPRARLPGRYAAAVCIALVLMTAVVLAASPAASATDVTKVSLRGDQTWTATGVILRPGDSVTISATGWMHFGPAPIDRVAPQGVGRRCLLPIPGTHWPAPDLSCWSLIARIGSSAPFEVGTRTTLPVRNGGELSLGINDDHLRDDAGAWTAVVTVRLPSRSGSTTPVAGAKETSKSSALLVIAVIALVAVVALVAILAVIAARRRRSPTRPSRRTRTPAPAVVDADPVQPMPSISVPDVPAADLDTAKGNIFEVEFADRESLGVSYGYFPEGTVVQCRVMHNSTTTATGEFVTNGGGTTQHYVTVPLGTQVTSALEGVKVQFSWTIGDLLQYSVTRDPHAARAGPR